jgi:hypothetical protein
MLDMRVVLLVLASFACTGAARRIQTPSDRISSSGAGGQQSQMAHRRAEESDRDPDLQEELTGEDKELQALTHSLVEVEQAEQVQEQAQPEVQVQFDEALYNELQKMAAERMKTVDKLRRGIPKLLRKNPDWKIFADDFLVIDQTSGTTVIGLEKNKQLLSLLRKLPLKNVRVQFTEIQFVETLWRNGRLKDEFREPFEPHFIAQWKFELGGNLFSQGPLDMEMETIFHLDGTNHIDYMMVRKCSANGWHVLHWPEINLLDDLATNTKKALAWIQDLLLQTSEAAEPSSPDQMNMPPTVAAEKPNIDIEKTLNILRANIPKLMSKELNWEIFDDDVLVIDQSGVTSTSGKSTRMLGKLLSTLQGKVVRDVQVKFTEMKLIQSTWQAGRLQGEVQEPRYPYVMAHWMVQLGTKGGFFGRWQKEETPIWIEADTVFHFGDENKIDYVQLKDVSVCGYALLRWPDVEVSESPDKSIQYIKEWIEDVRWQLVEDSKLQPAGDEATLRRLLELLNSNDPKAAAVINSDPQLRELYDLLTSSGEDPVVLDHGQQSSEA